MRDLHIKGKTHKTFRWQYGKISLQPPHKEEFLKPDTKSKSFKRKIDKCNLKEGNYSLWKDVCNTWLTDHSWWQSLKNSQPVRKRQTAQFLKRAKNLTSEQPINMWKDALCHWSSGRGRLGLNETPIIPIRVGWGGGGRAGALSRSQFRPPPSGLSSPVSYRVSCTVFIGPRNIISYRQ